MPMALALALASVDFGRSLALRTSEAQREAATGALEFRNRDLERIGSMVFGGADHYEQLRAVQVGPGEECEFLGIFRPDFFQSPFKDGKGLFP